MFLSATNMDIPELIVKHLKNELSGHEQQVLEQWIQASEKNKALFDSITNEEQLTAEMMQVLAIDRDAARKKALALEFPAVQSTVKAVWWKYMAAAAVLLVLLVSIYFIITDSNNTPVVTQGKNAPVQKDIAPGGNKAVLTLSDNSQIILDNAQNGIITQQGSAAVNKKDGLLEYSKTDHVGNAEMVYNTLSTPKGGQFQLVLPDGSKVWLNAASSIRYPVVFGNNERKVSITGEVYFEVATFRLRSGQKMPFRVKINDDAEVEVLGTHFNINSYSDEPVIQTTLLEGKVKVLSIAKGQSSILKPGEQVSLSHTSQLSQPIPVQINEVIAWKDGLFYFDNASIEAVMRQVARWYDVEVTYQDNIQQKFKGEIPRQVNVSALFEILESTGWVHFKINGRKIIVTQ